MKENMNYKIAVQVTAFRLQILYFYMLIYILADNCNVTETACSLYLDKNISFEGVRLQITNNMFVRCF